MVLRASTLRQQVRDFIHKSPGQPRLGATLHAGEQPFCVGPEQSALTEGDACAGQNEPRSRHVVSSEEWTLHPLTVQKIWEVFCRARVDLFTSKDKSHCPIFLHGARMPWPTNGPAFHSMLPPPPQSLCYRKYSDESGNNGTSFF